MSYAAIKIAEDTQELINNEAKAINWMRNRAPLPGVVQTPEQDDLFFKEKIFALNNANNDSSFTAKDMDTLFAPMRHAAIPEYPSENTINYMRNNSHRVNGLFKTPQENSYVHASLSPKESIVSDLPNRQDFIEKGKPDTLYLSGHGGGEAENYCVGNLSIKNIQRYLLNNGININNLKGLNTGGSCNFESNGGTPQLYKRELPNLKEVEMMPPGAVGYSKPTFFETLRIADKARPFFHDPQKNPTRIQTKWPDNSTNSVTRLIPGNHLSVGDPITLISSDMNKTQKTLQRTEKALASPARNYNPLPPR